MGSVKTPRRSATSASRLTVIRRGPRFTGTKVSSLSFTFALVQGPTLGDFALYGPGAAERTCARFRRRGPLTSNPRFRPQNPAFTRRFSRRPTERLRASVYRNNDSLVLRKRPVSRCSCNRNSSSDISGTTVRCRLASRLITT